MNDYLEYKACLSLRHTPGLGVRGLRKILFAHHSFSQAVSEAGTWSARGLCDDKKAKSFLSGSWSEGARREEEMARRDLLDFVSFYDEDYPEQLKNLPDPPPLLYYRGDVSLLDSPCVAVVGARNCSGLGRRAAFDIASGLSKVGIAVVSGLALGIDREAHVEGLKGIGGSIAVMGTGIDLVYPARNMDIWSELSRKGLVLSEFAPGTSPAPANFPIRNRIIAGLSLSVVVVEAAMRSGSLITARLALDLGRDVFAVPGPIEYASFAGCNRLIQQGARLYSTVEDLIDTIKFELDLKLKAKVAGSAPRRVREPGAVWFLDEASAKAGTGFEPRPIGPKADPVAAKPVPSGPAVQLDGFEGELYAKLDGGEAVHVDQLIRGLSREASQILRCLMGLELKGLVRKLPGMYYRAI